MTALSLHRPSGPRPARCALYVIRSADGLFKIGHACDPGRRLADLQIGSPGLLSLEFAAYTPAAARLETYFHERFVGRHVRGEWFALSPQDLQTIRAITLSGAPCERSQGAPALPPTAGATFGARLKAARAERGLSQQALAERAGLADKMTVWQLESGRRNPTWATVQALATALGCSTEDLRTNRREL